MNGFLPVTKEEIAERGWDSPDFVYVTGDAYVDHPSFGAAVITRVLEKEGFRIGVIAQPDWRDEKAFLALGRPRLGFLVSSGNLDSMVAHYTAAKKRRHDDAYSPGRRAGLRPDRAVETYCRAIRRAVPDAVILIGGMEASLRRFAHYDYWADEVLESILFSSGADLLSYGMGESSVTAVARRLAAGERISDITDVPGTCVKRESVQGLHGYVECPGFEKVKSSKDKYMDAALLQLGEQDPVRGKTVVQRQRRGYLVQNPPAAPLSGAELDAVYELPYTRTYHPMYESMGGVPAITEVKFSIIHNRGCFGGCNFCSLAFHQGRYVTARSHQSVLREAKQIIADKDFKGYIHDVGGPTANFRRTSCDKQHKSGLCRDRRCLAPGACPNLQVDHQDYLQLLRKLRALPGVKKVFIRSGIRFDYIMADRDESFFKELVEEHVSGQLKVAPEHLVNHVLDYMGKPHNEVFDRFRKRFYELSAAAGKEQYLVPYLMSSHPGSTLQDAVKLAEYLKKNHIRPEQVQDFYPTPGTLSTAMYYTELDPKTRKKLYVAKTPEDKRRQRILLQYYDPRYQREVAAALIKAGRRDLIGMEPRCLIRPLPGMGGAPQRKQGGKTAGNRGRRGAARWQNEAPQKGGRRKR